MTKEGLILNLDGGRKLQIPAKVTVVATSAALEVLRDSLDSRASDQLHLYELDLELPVPDEIVDEAEILVIEVNPDVPNSMERISQIGRVRPNLPLVVGLKDASVPTMRILLREGIEDIASVPFQLEEMLDSAANAFENADIEPEAEVTLAPLIALVKSRGGEGATTVSTHLAGHLAGPSYSSKGVCIIDLDIQAGSVSSYLGVTPRRSLEDLIEAGHRLDRSVLRSITVERQDGIHVISAPFDIQPLEDIDVDQLLRVLEIARQEYDFVIIDLPSNWTNWNLSTLLTASEVMMVVELDISSLRQAKRWLELFTSVGVKPSKMSIIVNRVEKKLFGSISLHDVKQALKRDVLVGLPNEGTRISTAQDQGLLYSEIQSKNKFDAEVAKLADILCARLSKEQAS